MGALLLSLLAISLPAVANAQTVEAEQDAPERSEDDGPGWMPSLLFHMGAFTAALDGETVSSESTFDPGEGDSFLTTTVGFEARLHTPLRSDLEVLGKPRLFLSGGFHRPLAEGLIAERIGSSFTRTNGGVPNPLFTQNCPDQIPEIGGGLTSAETCDLTIRNRVSIDAMWFAGIGLDFTLPISENQFHILPSISYYGLSAQSVGEFERTTRAGLNADDFIETANTVGDPELYHGISPAIAFLVDVYEEGPWRWSMFVEGRWIFFFDDPDLESGSSLGTNNLGFTASIDDNAPQFTSGVQVMFTGLGGRRGGNRR
ncbi:MAG: hypothetical protein AAGC67_03285 [Myxococcota bacterium]